MRIIGYAVRWDDHAVVDGRRERFAPGAFSGWLARGGPAVLTLDHGGPALAWVSFNTMRVVEDSRGLRVEADLRNAFGVDLAPIRTGVLNGLSMGFTAYREESRDGVRTILEASAGEVAIVDQPAYRQSRFIVCSGDGTREPDGAKEKYRIRLAVEREKLADVA